MRYFSMISLAILAANSAGAEECGNLCKEGYWTSNELSVIQRRISEAQFSNSLRNLEGETPLHLAAKYGSGQIISELVTRGLDLQSRQAGGLTPLHVAIKAHNKDTVVALLRLGSDPNTRSYAGYSPLHSAATGTSAILRLLLEAGARPNQVSDSGNSPLMFASGYDGSIENVRLLLEYGADATASNGTKTALHHAVQNLDPDETVKKVSALCAAGADPNLSLDGRDSPLNSAARFGYPAVLKALLAAGANPANKGVDGQFPLHNIGLRASTSGESAEILINAGAELNSLDDFGNTPLHIASENGASEVIQALVDHGALGNIKNRAGKTAFQVAAEGIKGSSAYWLLNDAQFQ